MKKTIKLTLVAALALGATSAFATNGSALIGMGTKARAMGGVSIGMSHGAESGLSNVALITKVKDKEVSFGGTIFMPSVSTDGGTSGMASYDSAADLNVIPEVSIAAKITDNFYAGIGMWGTAGMGVDYRDADTTMGGAMNMVTNLQLMQFGVPMAYAVSGFSVGITPVLQYGALDMNYKTDLGHVQYDAQGNPVGPVGSETVGAGVAQDLAFGFNLGVAYEISGVTIGAIYKSQIDMDYDGQISSATQPFVDGGIFPGAMSDTLSTPAEMGIGISYAMEGHTIAADYKQIAWSDAEGYKDFGWNDQDVISLGYQYAAKDWALRLGYNYSENPISDVGALTMAEAGQAAGGQPTPNYFGGNAINTFNLLGFPATVESHYSIGGSYELSKTTSIDLAYVYAPETETTLQTMPDMTTGQDGTTTVTHSQNSVSFQVSYLF